MEPEHYKFGGGLTETMLHPIVLVAMIIVILALILLPRKYTLGAFLFGTILIPLGQQFVVSGFHVFVFRIIVLAGLFRMLWSKCPSKTRRLAGGWNTIDTAFTLTVAFHVVAFSILYMDKTAIANQIGFIWDYLGAYLVLRHAIQEEEDARRAIECFVVITAIMAVCMVREQLTGQNLFGLLGGVRLVSETRGDHIRSEGVFQHAILAGTFGGTLLPLFVALWKNARSTLLAVVGVLSSTVMTLTTFSSTPVLSYLSGILAMFLWPLRKDMRLIRWSIALGVLALNALMNAPVWFIVAHIDVIGGSSTYHRADLLDTFIRHFSDWWLLGTANNNSWGYFMFDTSNAYVQTGVTGGLFALIFFILTISRSFGRVGKTRKLVQGSDRRTEWLLWLLGCALFANTVAFFGISYFDQTKVSWFALLAIVSAVTTPLLKGSVAADEPITAAAPALRRLGYSSPFRSAIRSNFSGRRTIKSDRVAVKQVAPRDDGRCALDCDEVP